MFIDIFFKAVVVGDAFWNYGFCFVLLCYKEAVKIFFHIEILVENISRFNMYGKVVVIKFCPLPDTRKAISSLLSLLGDKK